MKLVIQRVKKARLTVDDNLVSEIGKGLVVLLGVAVDDTEEKMDYLVHKLSGLRIFEDENEKLNKSLKDINGEMLLISNFTLLGEMNSGFRPSFTKSAKYEFASDMYLKFAKKLEENGIKVKLGAFGEDMQTATILDGPVTILMER